MKPGGQISVNILVSLRLGLVVQIILFLIKKRYKYAIISIDNTFHLEYVHLQISLSADTILKWKKLLNSL